MKLRDYLVTLRAMINEDKSILDLEVISASDDEGNSFSAVQFTPTIGKLDGTDFNAVSDPTKPVDEYTVYKEEANAICIN